MHKERVKIIHDFLEEHNLSALVLYRPEALVMSMGYHPHMGLGMAVFYRNHGPILYVSEYEPLDRILDEQPDIKKINFQMGTDAMGTFMNTIKADFNQYGNHTLPVGLVKDASQVAITGTVAEGLPFSNRWLEGLESLSTAGYIDISHSIQQIFAYKTKRDIEHIKKVFEVTQKGIDAFYGQLKAGQTEISIKACIEYAITLEGNRDDVFMASGFAQVQAGHHTTMSGRYNMATDNVLQDGDFVLLELAVCVNGYWCDITRTGYVGTPTQQAEAMYHIIKKAQKQAIAKLRAGVACSEIYDEAMNVIKEAGYEANFTHALGHGVGFRYHDYTPVIGPDNHQVLKEGMVVTIEPGIYGDAIGGGIRIEDNVVILKDGCNILSSPLRSGLKGLDEEAVHE